MRKTRRKRAVLAAVVAVVAVGALALASTSQAVRVIKGNLSVTFEGTITPSKLPRTGTAPVGVQMGGKIKSLAAGRHAAETGNHRPRNQPPREAAEQGFGNLLSGETSVHLL